MIGALLLALLVFLIANLFLPAGYAVILAVVVFLLGLFGTGGYRDV